LINKWSEKPVKITKERMFEIPEGFNLIIAYTGDVNSQLVSFEFPRYHEEHDLSLCLNQKLKWKNIKSGAEGVSNLI
jgi:hypothetical protein